MNRHLLKIPTLNEYWNLPQLFYCFFSISYLYCHPPRPYKPKQLQGGSHNPAVVARTIAAVVRDTEEHSRYPVTLGTAWEATVKPTYLCKTAYTGWVSAHRKARTHCRRLPHMQPPRSSITYSQSSSTHPHAMYGSTSLSMLSEALLSLTKTALLICLNLRSSRIFLVRG